MYTLRKDNERADTLSRRNDYIESKHIINEVIFKQEKDRLLVPR